MFEDTIKAVPRCSRWDKESEQEDELAEWLGEEEEKENDEFSEYADNGLAAGKPWREASTCS